MQPSEPGGFNGSLTSLPTDTVDGRRQPCAAHLARRHRLCGDGASSEQRRHHAVAEQRSHLRESDELLGADGTIIAQSGGITPTAKPSAGGYILDFGSPVTGKLIIASSAGAADVGDRGTVSAGPCGGTTEGSTCPSGNDTNHIRIITRKAGDSTAEDHPFYIAVIG